MEKSDLLASEIENLNQLIDSTRFEKMSPKLKNELKVEKETFLQSSVNFKKSFLVYELCGLVSNIDLLSKSEQVTNIHENRIAIYENNDEKKRIKTFAKEKLDQICSDIFDCEEIPEKENRTKIKLNKSKMPFLLPAHPNAKKNDLKLKETQILKRNLILADSASGKNIQNIALKKSPQTMTWPISFLIEKIKQKSQNKNKISDKIEEYFSNWIKIAFYEKKNFFVNQEIQILSDESKQLRSQLSALSSQVRLSRGDLIHMTRQKNKSVILWKYLKDTPFQENLENEMAHIRLRKKFSEKK